jgi:3,4-dihydroxy-2-butanone 4-phosphate synthase
MNTYDLITVPISPIADIVAELAAGRIVILVDEEDR